MNIRITEEICFKDVKIINFGYDKCTLDTTYSTTKNEGYLLHYILSGEGVLYIDDSSYNITTGQLFIIGPDESAIYTSSKDNHWSYIWVRFTATPSVDFNFAGNRVFKQRITSFTNDFDMKSEDISKEDYLIHKLFQLIFTVSYYEFDTKRYAEKAKDYILHNYMNKVNIADVAHSIGINKSYLSKIFKSEIKISFRDFLIKTRLEKANEYLKMGHNVSDVAIMCGYNEPCTFSRAYKNYYKISPSEVKPKIKKDK